MKILLLYLVMLLPAFIFGQKGLINKGMDIVLSPGSSIVIQDDYVNQSRDASNPGKIISDGEVIVGGDWYNNATSGVVFDSFNEMGQVSFIATSGQTIGGTSETHFGSLFVNTPELLLVTDIRAKGDLTIAGGIIKIGDSNLTLESNSQVLGAFSNSSMIVTNGMGDLRQVLNGAASFSYPLGDIQSLEEYSPLDLQVNSFSGNTDAYVSLRVDNNPFALLSDNTDYLSRYWTIAGDGINALNYDVTFSYLDADVVGNENNLYAARFVGTERSIHNATNVSANTIEIYDNSEFAVFTAVDNYTGIDAMTGAEGFTIYPNPTRGKFRLKSNELIDSEIFVEIVSETGAVVEKTEIQPFEYNSQNGIEFDLKEGYKGLFLIKVFTDKQLMQQKLIIY